ncbi:MAG: cell division protein FtsL [Candidatus Marinimicrobia bacterium]|nr:cell division protein FtsL [Candidatus Neomarinimicrobiota bacterium]MCF7839308.1 cell division protein FtsL [Candidatus Neomarinimicrobiota bacterium]MCF7902123.1 cell division protein FtsL [Candidatus Neomarinimicrobiota bacterium]
MKRRNGTFSEIVKSLMYISVIPLVAGGLFMYVHIEEQVREASAQIEKLRAQEAQLRNRQSVLISQQKRATRPDQLTLRAVEQLDMVQPIPESITIVVPQ